MQIGINKKVTTRSPEMQMEERYSPTGWKQYIVIPVQKDGKNLADPNCYRQILASLFSCVVKLMERIIDK